MYNGGAGSGACAEGVRVHTFGSTRDRECVAKGRGESPPKSNIQISDLGVRIADGRPSGGISREPEEM